MDVFYCNVPFLYVYIDGVDDGSVCVTSDHRNWIGLLFKCNGLFDKFYRSIQIKYTNQYTSIPKQE